MPELVRNGYHSYTLYGGDSTYLYGLGHFTAYVYKINKQKVATNGVNIQTLSGNGAGDYIPRMWATSVDGEIYAMVRRVATNKYYLYRSIDGGAHFGANASADDGNYVLMFGDVDGTTANQLADVRPFLADAFLEATIGGQRTLLVAEYQSNTSPNNNPVRVMKSTDGITWTQVVKFNNGRQSIRHIHLIVQDPYTNDIYIGTGDNSNECGIIKWDGTGTLPDDAPANYPSYANVHYTGIGGSQRHRALSILFTATNIFVGADTVGTVDNGIWRTDRTFSSYTKIDNQVAAFDKCEMGYGITTSGGIMLMLTYQELPCAYPWWLFASSDNGATWQRIAEIQKHPAATVASLTKMFEWQGRVYISGENNVLYGSDATATIACTVNSNSHVGDPQVVHPQYSYNGADGVLRVESATNGSIFYPLESFPSNAIRVIHNGSNYSVWVQGQEGVAPK